MARLPSCHSWIFTVQVSSLIPNTRSGGFRRYKHETYSLSRNRVAPVTAVLRLPGFEVKTGRTWHLHLDMLAPRPQTSRNDHPLRLVPQGRSLYAEVISFFVAFDALVSFDPGHAGVLVSPLAEFRGSTSGMRNSLHASNALKKDKKNCAGIGPWCSFLLTEIAGFLSVSIASASP